MAPPNIFDENKNKTEQPRGKQLLRPRCVLASSTNNVNTQIVAGRGANVDPRLPTPFCIFDEACAALNPINNDRVLKGIEKQGNQIEHLQGITQSLALTQIKSDHRSQKDGAALAKQTSDSWVAVQSLQTSDGGILDPDDRLQDVVDDREQILATFSDGDGPHHGGGDGASGSSVGTSSPDIFQRENGNDLSAPDSTAAAGAAEPQSPPSEDPVGPPPLSLGLADVEEASGYQDNFQGPERRNFEILAAKITKARNFEGFEDVSALVSSLSLLHTKMSNSARRAEEKAERDRGAGEALMAAQSRQVSRLDEAVNNVNMAAQKLKRVRIMFTAHQLQTLEKSFELQKYPSFEDRTELAAKLGISELRVYNWYQNRRKKMGKSS